VIYFDFTYALVFIVYQSLLLYMSISLDFRKIAFRQNKLTNLISN